MFGVRNHCIVITVSVTSSFTCDNLSITCFGEINLSDLEYNMFQGQINLYNLKDDTLRRQTNSHKLRHEKLLGQINVSDLKYQVSGTD